MSFSRCRYGPCVKQTHANTKLSLFRCNAQACTVFQGQNNVKINLVFLQLTRIGTMKHHCMNNCLHSVLPHLAHRIQANFPPVPVFISRSFIIFSSLLCLRAYAARDKFSLCALGKLLNALTCTHRLLRRCYTPLFVQLPNLCQCSTFLWANAAACQPTQ